MKKCLKFYVILALCFVLLLLLFTFSDLMIAKMVYDPNSLFGRFFEVIGTLPMPIVGIFSCVALVTTANRKLCFTTFVSYILGLLLLLYFAFYGILCIVYAWSVTLVPMIIATIIWLCLSVYLTIKNSNKDNLRKVAIVGVGCCVVAVIGVSIIKNFMGRPRFYTLDDPDTQFLYWFIRQPYPVNASFPSGHAAQSALTFVSLLVPTFIEIKDTKKYQKIALVFSIIFTLCVMLSRMVLGVHYASDVLVGACLTITTFLILIRVTNIQHA